MNDVTELMPIDSIDYLMHTGCCCDETEFIDAAVELGGELHAVDRARAGDVGPGVAGGGRRLK